MEDYGGGVTVANLRFLQLLYGVYEVFEWLVCKELEGNSKFANLCKVKKMEILSEVVKMRFSVCLISEAHASIYRHNLWFVEGKIRSIGDHMFKLGHFASW